MRDAIMKLMNVQPERAVEPEVEYWCGLNTACPTAWERYYWVGDWWAPGSYRVVVGCCTSI